MIVTTTNSVEGYVIQEYKGIVFGEIVEGMHIGKDFMASLSNVFGGRVNGYEEEIIRTRNEALNEMMTRAQALGANAIIGVKLDYETLGDSGGMMMVTASGTAVVIAQ